jgi:CubicO group peptidase (beta-lactamase class C family)
MASGLDYRAMRWFIFNGDDPLTTDHPDQRKIASTNTNIVDSPGQYFLYDKYHPQLLGMILERATGMTVTDYTQMQLWDPLGMGYDGAWALDSAASGFEKMEAGLNARAIDYAKFGRLFLEGGVWDGLQMVSSRWVEESTSLDATTHTPEYYAESFGPGVYDGGAGYYRYMWYGRQRNDRQPDFSAAGDHGQFIHVSAANSVIIVRSATNYGIPFKEWVDVLYDAADRL